MGSFLSYYLNFNEIKVLKLSEADFKLWKRKTGRNVNDKKKVISI